mgnify:CR=1 FL=1
MGFSLPCYRFYTECLGMKLLRKRDIPDERYTNAFLGYGPEDSHFVVELTYSMPLLCSYFLFTWYFFMGIILSVILHMVFQTMVLTSITWGQVLVILGLQ